MSDGFQAQSTTDTCFCGRHNHAPWSGAWYGDEWHSLMVCGLGAEVQRLTDALTERDRRIEAALTICEQAAKHRTAAYGLDYLNGFNDALDIVEQALRGES